MASTAEKIADELVQLVAPLEQDALEAIVSLVKQVIAHPDGAALTATRTAEALAAKALIRS